ALVEGVGPRLRQLLLARFGSCDAVLAASTEELRQVQGIGPKLAKRIREAPSTEEVQALVDDCRRNAVRILTEADADYPPLLRETATPPSVLFARGEILPQDRLAVAVVGTRHASSYGLSVARNLAAALARRGFTIVSGLARGIDAAAHRGAIEAGGRTIAVLGSGVLNVYPPEHAELAAEIARCGAVVSEAPLRAAPHAGNFPQRNRIISGMSLGTIVVEAGSQSGALITARHAAEQNREVFAVPGRIDRPHAKGCHRLIRDGAHLVDSADDVLEALGPLPEPVPVETQAAGSSQDEKTPAIRHPAELQLNPVETKVLAAVEAAPTPIDEVIVRSGLETQQVLATLSVLEMRRLVKRTSGTT
ncbi:MAG: DNA-protecting protein DprA, partial [Planctomycetota bacterium]